MIQGVGGNAQCIEDEDKNIVEYYPPPRFSTEIFFIIISSLFIAALVAFIMLDQLKSVRKEYAKVTICHGNKFEYYDDAKNDEKNGQLESKIEEKDTSKSIEKLSNLKYRGLLVLLGAVCMFVNAIFPSVMPFGKLGLLKA